MRSAEIAKGKGSLADKAKAAAEALKSQAPRIQQEPVQTLRERPAAATGDPMTRLTLGAARAPVERIL